MTAKNACHAVESHSRVDHVTDLLLVSSNHLLFFFSKFRLTVQFTLFVTLEISNFLPQRTNKVLAPVSTAVLD